jgi:hypothetical protein
MLVVLACTTARVATAATTCWRQTGASASADPKKEARERYQRATELYNDGAYPQALIEFQRAYELAPAAAILYNIGQTALVSGQAPLALCAFQAYLNEAGPRVPLPRRRDIEAEIERLNGRVARLTVTSNLDGAEVLIDDDKVGVTPLDEAVTVNTGRHEIVVRKGDLERRATVILAGQDHQTVNLVLEAVTRTTTPKPPKPGPRKSREKEPTGKPRVVWAGWLVTGLLAGGAIATGMAALSASSKAGDLRRRIDPPPGSIEAEHDKARALGITADVLGAAAIIAGGVTLYFTLAGNGDDGDAKAEVSLGPLPWVQGSF